MALFVLAASVRYLMLQRKATGMKEARTMQSMYRMHQTNALYAHE